LKQLRKIDDPGPLRADVAALVGQSLFYLGRLRPAEQALLFAISERPDHADAHRALAALYYDQGALERTMEHLREVSRLDPEDGRRECLRAVISRDMDQRPGAAAAYEEALRRRLPADKREEALTDLAELLVSSGTFAKAAKVLDRLDAAAAE